jgi:Zn-finger nucleic acid-binding protein
MKKKTCPNDSQELLRNPFYKTFVEHCPQCRGTFLNVDTVDSLIESPTFKKHWLDKKLLDPKELNTPLRRCPECTTPMREFKLPDLDFQFEICLQCQGVWLDHGELDFIDERLGPEKEEKVTLTVDQFLKKILT